MPLTSTLHSQHIESTNRNTKALVANKELRFREKYAVLFQHRYIVPLVEACLLREELNRIYVLHFFDLIMQSLG